jgi:hypothetical protein
MWEDDGADESTDDNEDVGNTPEDWMICDPDTVISLTLNGFPALKGGMVILLAGWFNFEAAVARLPNFDAALVPADCTNLDALVTFTTNLGVATRPATGCDMVNLGVDTRPATGCDMVNFGALILTVRLTDRGNDWTGRVETVESSASCVVAGMVGLLTDPGWELAEDSSSSYMLSVPF